MKLEVCRIDRSLPLPRYETAGSVAFDLLARTDTTVAPGAVGRVPANLIVRVPAGHALILASRSSTPAKKGLSVPHGIGVIDCDYCGPEDELLVQVFNFTAAPVTVARGERVAQALIVPTAHCELVEMEKPADRSRGGFGSTG